MAAGLLDKLTFKSESESDPGLFSDSESESEFDSDLLDPDPAPKRARKARRPVDAPKVTAAVKREARETLEALYELPVTLWKRRDPTCAAVAQEQQEEVIDAFLAFVVKRPAWLAALTDLGQSGDWLRMLKAIYPIAMIVFAHHVARTASEEEGPEDDLSAYNAPRLAV